MFLKLIWKESHMLGLNSDPAGRIAVQIENVLFQKCGTVMENLKNAVVKAKMFAFRGKTA